MITSFPLQSFRLAAFFLFILIVVSCSRESFEARKPVYISLPQIELDTDGKGTTHHKITTAFVYINGVTQGSYELPVTFPVLFDEGENEIAIYSGINLNGVSYQRALYEAYTPLRYTYNYSDDGTDNVDTITYFEDVDNRTANITDYMHYEVLEDFDNSGTLFSATNRSDTNLVITDKPGEVFTLAGEDNGSAGKFIFGGKRTQVEAVTSLSYPIPTSTQNIYLEFTYKCNVPIQVGVISQLSGSSSQEITAVINPKDEWNKIYINLITEIDANRNADSYKFYFGGVNSENLDTAKIFVDNIKLVY